MLARDKTIKKIKGNLPFYNEFARKQQIKKLNLVKKIILGSTANPYSVLDKIKPELIVLGPDQKTFINHLHEELASRKLITILERAQPYHIDILKSSKIRPCLADPKNNGFLLINKPAGLTSHDVVNKIRAICSTKRVGHAGTLDPLATGLLVIGVNMATRLLSWWQLFPKSYHATLELGKSSDTFDIQGKIKKTSARTIFKKTLITTISKFQGQQYQIPPPFSAKKINGQPAYKLARQGLDFKLKKQLVNIHWIKLLAYDFPSATLEINCSSGTYIRSLINDIGQALRTGAVMTKLQRIKIGETELKQAGELNDLKNNNWSNYLFPVHQFLSDLNNQELTANK